MWREQVLAMLRGAGRARGRASCSSRAWTTTAICASDDATLAERCGVDAGRCRRRARRDPALRAGRRRCARPRRVPGPAAGREGPARPGHGGPARQPAAAGPRRLRRADAALRRRRRGPPGHDRRDQAPGPQARAGFNAEEPADAGARPVRARCWSGPLAGRAEQRHPAAGAGRQRLPHRARPRTRSTGAAKEYLSERLQSANWLAKALDQRARTVLRVAKAIFARQLPFLDGGVQQLRPLVLRDIAAATGLHESTVSRATAGKYVATPHGTFPIKYFFTTAIAASSGEQSHSAEAIRQLIRRMIEREAPTRCSRTTRSWPNSRSATS